MKRAANESGKAPAERAPRKKAHTVADLWNELENVRSTLGRRIEELEVENERLRKSHWATEEHLQKRIRKLEKDVADRDKKIGKLEKQVAWLRKEKFGKKDEKTKPEPTEATDEADESKSAKRSRGQQRGSDGHGRTDRSNIPVSDTVPLKVPAGCKCKKCGKPYLELAVSEDSVTTEIAVMLFAVMYQRYKYVSQCDCEGKKNHCGTCCAQAVSSYRPWEFSLGALGGAKVLAGNADE